MNVRVLMLENKKIFKLGIKQPLIIYVSYVSSCSCLSLCSIFLISMLSFLIFYRGKLKENSFEPVLIKNKNTDSNEF